MIGLIFDKLYNSYLMKYLSNPTYQSNRVKYITRMLVCIFGCMRVCKNHTADTSVKCI